MINYPVQGTQNDAELAVSSRIKRAYLEYRLALLHYKLDEILKEN